ncbi:ribonuclease P/MRP protein subunit POP5 [Adelges cooleyi]|uniref:ribonuclease P/MRP protein subunit POP5 n=1 Tax=Adelges cooleyi TaxID=133065 RepID=UPI00217F9BB2|nr:ribonuclease P/MRP protein subunit POP5 [Adelges cooleyi]
MVRYKNRYLVVQLNILENNDTHLKITNKDLQLSVLNVLKTLHGDFGVGAIQTCFKVHYCNVTNKIIIFKTRHGPHTLLSSAIPFVNKLQDGIKIKLSTIYTGASIFQCHKFIKNFQNNLVRQVSDKINESTAEKMLSLSGVLKFKKTQLVS